MPEKKRLGTLSHSSGRSTRGSLTRVSTLRRNIWTLKLQTPRWFPLIIKHLGAAALENTSEDLRPLDTRPLLNVLNADTCSRFLAVPSSRLYPALHTLTDDHSEVKQSHMCVLPCDNPDRLCSRRRSFIFILSSISRSAGDRVETGSMPVCVFMYLSRKGVCLITVQLFFSPPTQCELLYEPVVFFKV